MGERAGRQAEDGRAVSWMANILVVTVKVRDASRQVTAELAGLQMRENLKYNETAIAGSFSL